MHIRQAIVTKFLGPTNFRGSRIKASASAGAITVDYPHAINIEQPGVVVGAVREVVDAARRSTR